MQRMRQQGRPFQFQRKPHESIASKWIGDADAIRHMDQFNVRQIPLAYDYQRTRKDDLYISLVGELFERLQQGYDEPADWARLGNALAQYAASDRATELHSVGINLSDAALFSAAAST